MIFIAVVTVAVAWILLPWLIPFRGRATVTAIVLLVVSSAGTLVYLGGVNPTTDNREAMVFVVPGAASSLLRLLTGLVRRELKRQ
jgi:hypothetical protein